MSCLKSGLWQGNYKKFILFLWSLSDVDFWITVPLQNPAPFELHVTNWPNVLLQDLLSETRIHGSTSHSGPRPSHHHCVGLLVWCSYCEMLCTENFLPFTLLQFARQVLFQWCSHWTGLTVIHNHVWVWLMKLNLSDLSASLNVNYHTLIDRMETWEGVSGSTKLV